jgi:amino acid transporter
MKEFLEFAFSSFWIWLGITIWISLIVSAFSAFFGVIVKLLSKRKETTVYYNDLQATTEKKD